MSLAIMIQNRLLFILIQTLPPSMYYKGKAIIDLFAKHQTTDRRSDSQWKVSLSYSLTSWQLSKFNLVGTADLIPLLRRI